MPPSTRSNSKPTRRRQQRSSATRPAQLPELVRPAKLFHLQLRLDHLSPRDLTPEQYNERNIKCSQKNWGPSGRSQNSTIGKFLLYCTTGSMHFYRISLIELYAWPNVEVLLRMQPSKSVDSMKFYLTDQHYYYFFKTQFAWQSTFWNVRFLVV